MVRSYSQCFAEEYPMSYMEIKLIAVVKVGSCFSNSLNRF
ncbi:hypothetical protein LEP1GSC017_0419 [Leptospira meyeri serovar Hardjo str. Went 5]|nr:hypothetical protein LEP1GSC017_0419 [Leptospira meyeri serovar Hardjo str. Went 5]